MTTKARLSVAILLFMLVAWIWVVVMHDMRWEASALMMGAMGWAAISECWAAISEWRRHRREAAGKKPRRYSHDGDPRFADAPQAVDSRIVPYQGWRNRENSAKAGVFLRDYRE